MMETMVDSRQAAAQLRNRQSQEKFDHHTPS
jgi:hypothetical protein